MIRHSNSFIFSIFIHIAIFIALFISYQELKPGVKKQKEETLLRIKLSVMQDKVVRPIIPKIKTHKVRPIIPKIKTHKVKPVEVKYVQKSVKKRVEKKQVIIKKNVLVSENIVKKTPSKKEKEVIPKKTKEITTKVVKVIKEKVAPEKEYIDENIAKIIALLKENLYYPRRARKRAIQGEVLVRFTLSNKAEISNIEVLSSTSEVLSRGAIQTISNVNNILPKPKQEITFNIPISYILH
ncbi:MAG: TonB family protein [Sulfurimonas sp.]|nr:TonB family protein [Sulfurimonas sp.]